MGPAWSTILIQRGGGAGECFYGGGHEVKITQPGTRNMFYTLAPDALKSEDLIHEFFLVL
jgi:hypothetical protein